DYYSEIIFYKIKRHDVVIHEIMAKPDPVVMLPDAEYIELKNCKAVPIELTNYKLEVGSHHWALPNITIPADSFALIVGKTNEVLYNHFPNVYAISSMSITNSGQRISLYNVDNEIIHSVNFSEMWHQEAAKRGGGWSLEMIDSSNPCEEEENWSSSIAPEGGTPGKKNSVTKDNPDVKPPLMVKISVPDAQTILLMFDETMLTTPHDWNDYITIDRGISIDTAMWLFPDGKTLQISTKTPLLPDKLYTLTIKNDLCDCFGLPVQRASSIQFGLDNPHITPRDLIINEIMTNPVSAINSTYIELYNFSDKIIDLKNIKIGEGGNDLPEKWVIADPTGCQILPKQYVVLCKNKKTTLEEYFVPYPERLLRTEHLINFGKQADLLFITDISLNIIDKLSYASHYHYELLTSTKGVSLEKINFTADSEDQNSWKSASALSGFGTPGYLNSQYQEIELDDDRVVSVQPDIFSPDGDGFDDYCQIVCTLKGEDNRISITIYNRDGYLVKKITNNTYCGSQSIVRWDGNTEAGGLVSPDLYVVKVECWNLSGKRKTILKSVGVR
ncbi:MAG: lamin tail domain-containing protein, partial [Bacteroidales bacterium]|nr:lamin tail domain-containing protein [Bacteroidales bacterium]